MAAQYPGYPMAYPAYAMGGAGYPAGYPGYPPAAAYGAPPVGYPPQYSSYPPQPGYPGYPPVAAYGFPPIAYPPQMVPGYPGFPPPSYPGHPPHGYSAYPPQGHYSRTGSRSRSRSRRRSRSTSRNVRGRGNKNDKPQARVEDAAGVETTMGTEALRNELQLTIATLYEDGIKPMQNYVKGRLKERSCSAGLVSHCVEICGKFPDLFEVSRPSQSKQDDVVISLVAPPSSFTGWIDVDSAEDPYDNAMWEEFATFLRQQSGFAGGRYGMARDLKQKKLPFFENYSLGKVCHIVQLAIQHRKLLVYHRKMLRSVATLEAAPAESAQEAITDVDDLCSVLFTMLNKHPQGIPLCRLKQDIKHDFSRTLSETNFQCTKLGDVFSKEPLSSAFVLQACNDGNSFNIKLGNSEMFTDKLKQMLSNANASSMHGANVPVAGTISANAPCAQLVVSQAPAAWQAPAA